MTGGRPAAILRDPQMPGANGIEATRRILETAPGTAVLVLTMYDDVRGRRLGVRRHAGGRQGLRPQGGGSGRDPPHHPRGGQRRGDLQPGRGAAAHARLRRRRGAGAGLSRTDRAGGAGPHCRGKSNTELARQLVLSQKTVRNHVSTVFGTLQVADRAQAVVRAREAGLGRGGRRARSRLRLRRRGDLHQVAVRVTHVDGQQGALRARPSHRALHHVHAAGAEVGQHAVR